MSECWVNVYCNPTFEPPAYWYEVGFPSREEADAKRKLRLVYRLHITLKPIA